MKNSSREGQLVLVATPLGNLGDVTRRALELFALADALYCEDTRHSRALFSAYDIPSRARLHSLHEHNEAAQCEKIVERVRAGQLVVLVSDAGTPGICDPGARVVAAALAAGVRVTCAPGPSAVIAALTLSGLSSERFIMEGFLPRKLGERERRYDQWRGEERTVVFYESPQRVGSVLDELAQRFPRRRVAVARELTKFHEEVIRGTLGDVVAQISSRELLGEIVVVLEGEVAAHALDEDLVRRALGVKFFAGASTRDAVNAVVEETGLARRVVYELALAIRKNDSP